MFRLLSLTFPINRTLVVRLKSTKVYIGGQVIVHCNAPVGNMFFTRTLHKALNRTAETLTVSTIG